MFIAKVERREREEGEDGSGGPQPTNVGRNLTKGTNIYDNHRRLSKGRHLKGESRDSAIVKMEGGSQNIPGVLRTSYEACPNERIGG